jgi:hypothetical protein
MQSMRWLRVTAICGLAYMIFCFAASAIDVVVTSSWNLTVSSSDLSSGAGSDLQGSFESPSSQVSITVSNTVGGGDTWRIDVRRSDSVWNGNISLWIVRTGDGSGGSVSGGLTYVEILSTDRTFFSGSEDVSGIPAQLKLDGFSINIPVGSYGTTVTFTVVDT